MIDVSGGDQRQVAEHDHQSQGHVRDPAHRASGTGRVDSSRMTGMMGRIPINVYSEVSRQHDGKIDSSNPLALRGAYVGFCDGLLLQFLIVEPSMTAQITSEVDHV